MIQRELAATDTVFHFTTYDKADGIIHDGLLPNPERGDTTWQRVEQLLDDVRPARIRELGIARRDGTYAFPDLNGFHPMRLSSEEYEEYVQSPDGNTAFGINVDPRKVMVFEMHDLDLLPWQLEQASSHTMPSTSATNQALAYWNNGVSLANFRRCYTPDDYGSYDLREQFQHMNSLKAKFRTPEVIVPGPVVADLLHWAASELVLRATEFETV